jgi:hypothetical protein
MTPSLQIQQLFCTNMTAISHICHAILDRQTRWELSLQTNRNRYSECRYKQTGSGTPHQPTFYDIFSSSSGKSCELEFDFEVLLEQTDAVLASGSDQYKGGDWLKPCVRSEIYLVYHNGTKDFTTLINWGF